MSELHAAGRPPAVLLVSDHDWLVLALGTAASGWGFAVGRAASVAQALHVADATDPDVVFVDVWMDDASPGVSVARALREAGAIGPATPLVAFSAGALSREERLAALAAGAWDVIELPVDTAALRLRLGTWLAAKRHADRLEGASVHDHSAPIYNLRGLLLRARELGADAARSGSPLCCVAIGVGAGPTACAVGRRPAAELPAPEWLRSVWSTGGRASDVIGRVGPAQFVVLAPRTGSDGGHVLADRLARALDLHDVGGAVRTGVLALEPTPTGPDDAEALVSRTVALLHRPPPLALAAG